MLPSEIKSPLGRPPSWVRRIVAKRFVLGGVFDAGLASLATFATGVYAARSFSPLVLGGYAVAFSAFQLAAFVPAQLIFAPVEIGSVEVPRERRMALLMRSVLLGAGPAVLGALMVALCMWIWVLVSAPAIADRVVIELAVPTMATAFISPIQDHLRRLCHLSGKHWRAAAISAVQLLVASGAILGLRQMGRHLAWAPFTALALANLLSFLFGLLVARRELGSCPLRTSLAALLHKGGWILAAGLAPSGAGFLARVIVSRLIGVAVLGYVEAARIVGQPLVVLAAGLTAIVMPLSMEAARRADVVTARRVSWLFDSSLFVLGLVYLGAVEFSWPGNLLPKLLPNAYTVPGLVAATVLANILFNTAHPYRYELFAAGAERSVANIEIVGNIIRTLIAGCAAVLGAFAIPAGIAALGAARWIGCLGCLKSYYEAARQRRSGAAVPSTSATEVQV
jgi:O-antigen/teichoic acid export membrane protein